LRLTNKVVHRGLLQPFEGLDACDYIPRHEPGRRFGLALRNMRLKRSTNANGEPGQFTRARAHAAVHGRGARSQGLAALPTFKPHQQPRHCCGRGERSDPH
jgi:hypothetical protein